MKIKSPVSFGLGLGLTIFGGVGIFITNVPVKIIPLFIGLSLIYLGLKGTRTATAVFGHITVVSGCFLITYGFYLLPYA
ncbi:MAG: hypothetical protein ACPL28_08885 [bacterium]